MLETNEQRIRREYRELEQNQRKKRKQELIASGYPQRATKTIMVPKVIRVCAKCGNGRLLPYKGIEKAYKCNHCGQWHTLDL